MKSPATDAADALMRCRASQRRFRNTLVFVAPDEANLANAREVMRKAMAWASIDKDGRLQQQMTQAQATDAKDKAKTNRESALKAIRGLEPHPLSREERMPGKPFDLEHSLISRGIAPPSPSSTTRRKRMGLLLRSSALSGCGMRSNRYGRRSSASDGRRDRRLVCGLRLSAEAPRRWFLRARSATLLQNSTRNSAMPMASTRQPANITS